MTRTTEFEYEMKCPKCSQTFSDDRPWVYCPFDGQQLQLSDSREVIADDIAIPELQRRAKAFAALC